MQSFKSAFLFGVLVACGTLTATAAEPATEPGRVDSDAQKITERLDKLIVEKLTPEPLIVDKLVPDKAESPIRIRARVRVASPLSTMAQGGLPPATQPTELVLEVPADQIRWFKDADLQQQRLADVELARAEEQKVLAEARLAVQRAHEQSDGPYLGIGVDSPDDTLRAQLSLPPGAGLVVNFVDDNGPSKSAVQLHDVLQKLDDQLLINGEQLVALVRMHKVGDTVSLTLLRRAKPMTVEVELGRRKVSQGKAEPNLTWHAGPADYAPQQLQGWATALGSPQSTFPNYYEPLYSNLASTYWAKGWQPATVKVQDRPTTFNDGELLVSFTGHGDLVAIDVKDGKVLFHGPIGTEQQWNAMPKLVKDKLSSWRSVVLPSGSTNPTATKDEPRAK